MIRHLLRLALATTLLVTAMPRYFAVSRTTEIDTPSPPRAASISMT